MELNNKICICLAHEILNNYNLSFDYKSRLNKAFEVFLQNNCDSIILTSNSKSKKNLKSEAQMALEYLSKNFTFDIKKAILLEESRDTVGEAIYSKIRIDDLNFKLVYVITSDWHLKRAKYIFKKIYGSNYKIIFITIKGEKKLFDLEKDNSSQKKFDNWYNVEYSADNKTLLNKLINNHRLYKDV
jgi:uncharacterized SAM-binding protein YcdF (DUF218 family)